MCSNYTKTFIFRDCFDAKKVIGDIEAINRLLNKKQIDGNVGCFVVTDVLYVGTVVNKIEAYESEDDGTWNLCFFNKNNEVTSVSIWDYKEVQLRFEIEEVVETGEITIHYCKVKAFKEYQM